MQLAYCWAVILRRTAKSRQRIGGFVAKGGALMATDERVLAEVKDSFGVIRVVEVGDYRFLEFGDGIEQSCVFTSDPSWLEYDYTRAMFMAGLFHEAPETALFLGLGAGNLTQACLKYFPLDDVEVIELRPDRNAAVLGGFSPAGQRLQIALVLDHHAFRVLLDCDPEHRVLDLR